MGLLQRIEKLQRREHRGTKYDLIKLRITGASLPSGTATNAPLSSGLGKEIAVATDGGGSNVVITFNEKLSGTPIVESYFSNSTTSLNFTSLANTAIAYTSSSADLDCVITLLVPRPDVY